jgi:DNA helicase-2/ATP-dependent DNA helicase PcrA
MDILSQLNPAQRDAVKIVEGPVLVLAGPGSGKTRVLTHRVAFLIHECRVPPYNILAVTFTNKAAREMRERLVQLVGEARMQNLTIGTFHATCARFLRRDGERVGLARGFVIYDDDDQTTLMKQILKELNLNEKIYRPGAVLGAIGKAKNELIGPDEYVPPSYWHEAVGRAYKRYQQLLAENNAVDFDDLLMAAVRLLSENRDVLERYQNRYLYLHVDEFQDTNIAQYVLAKLLADKHQNLFCVGDEDQCLLPKTKIQMPSGRKNVDQVRAGDMVNVAAGRGKTMGTPVERVHRQEYHGKIIEIRTQHGHTLRVTPNHMLFARLGLVADIHYVYLMYRVDRGFRIGVAMGTRSDGIHEQPYTGLMLRGNQEHADKVWILRVCCSKTEAIFYEQYFAFHYGIPTTVFHSTGRRMQMTNEQIARLYNEISTHERALRLMADLSIFPNFPHHRPKGIAGERLPDRIAVNLRLFGDTRRSEASPWSAHRVSLNTSDRKLEHHLQGLGFHTRPGRRKTWRIEKSNLDYDKADAFARDLAKKGENLEIARCAFLTDSKSVGGLTLPFDFQPASHIHPTMLIPVLENGEIVEDQVVNVTWEDYAGFVYDLDIPKVHNYIANGIVVHNSIYGWRGADYRNVLRFREDFPNARVVLLEQNYRSTQTILDAAQAIIRKNKSRHKKKLWTENLRGTPITIFEAYNEEEEAQFVVDEIARLTSRGDPRGRPDSHGHPCRPRDCAVFYRTNAQSRNLEDAFVRRGMPYQLIGATRFYQRREVKDLLAYLRLVHNLNDGVAFNRVLNVPARGIGKRTEDELAHWAERLGVSQYAVLQMLRETADDGPPTADATRNTHPSTPLRSAQDATHNTPPVTRHPSLPSDAFDSRARKPLLAFANLLDEWIAARQGKVLTELFDLILDKTGYEQYVRDGTGEGDERWDNVMELRRVTKKYAGATADVTLPQFLEEVALVADIDTMKDNVDAPTLMTLHTAKGLEFRVVFIIGMEEGLVPHSRSFDDPDQMEEERRLCYVGMTRAKEQLYLVHAFRRSSYGNSEPGDPSRYLADIPHELITDGRPPTADRRPTDGARNTQPCPERGRRDAIRNTQYATRHTEFRAGDKVHHPTFGDGVIVSSKISGEDEEVEVAFVGKGVKRLVARYAGLKKR